MERLRFKMKINAPKEKVWNALWSDDTYPRWTRVFSEGSRAISDWNEGSKIIFLNGENDGMYSVIDKKVENEQMVFKHLGVILKGEEQPSDEKTKAWEGAIESYFLDESNGVTELTVDVDCEDDFVQYMRDTFPKALEDLKQLVIEQPAYAGS